MVLTEHSNTEESSKNAKELGDTFLFTVAALAIVLSAVVLIVVITLSITQEEFGISAYGVLAAAFVSLSGVVIAAILIIGLFGAAVIAYRRKREREAEIDTGRTG